MSVLSFPRLYFRGTISWDPVVSNNDADNYDGITARAKLAAGETVSDFRKRLIATTEQRGDWNYFGTHVCTLEGARVTGGAAQPHERDQQPHERDVREDALVHAPVDLVGKLVDIDPTGVCSQIFFDEFSFGTPGGAHLHARPRRRMSARWLNFRRNLGQLPIAGGASAAWQAVLPAEDVEIVRSEESALLASLADALCAPHARGLMVRLSTYRTEYFQNGLRNPLDRVATLAELRRLHEQGNPISNPAYSLVVGVVGLWFEGDSESVPGGRVLFGQSQVPVLNSPGRLAGAGPAAAEFHPGPRILSLDFSNTVPELDQDVEKADFGQITVIATENGDSTEVGRIEPLAYDRAAYEVCAGIIDVDVLSSVDEESLRGALSLRVDTPAGPAVVLAERELEAFCDDCNVYLDEGETRTLVIHARERGEVPTLPLSILVGMYDADMSFTGQTTVLPTSADGTADLEIRAETAGYRHFGFIAFRGDEPEAPILLSIGTAQFTSVRTLPFDDGMEAATADAELTYDFVYTNILQTYDAITPRMSTILDLSDADTVRTFARRIKEVTAAELFESGRYMPVTRDLSRGKRRLLHRFCDLVLVARSPDESLAVSRATEVSRGPEVARDEVPGVPLGKPFEKRALP